MSFGPELQKWVELAGEELLAAFRVLDAEALAQMADEWAVVIASTGVQPVEARSLAIQLVERTMLGSELHEREEAEEGLVFDGECGIAGDAVGDDWDCIW